MKDEGIEITQTQVKNLFKFDTIVTSEGTTGETCIGFGLILSKKLVEMNAEQIL